MTEVFVEQPLTSPGSANHHSKIKIHPIHQVLKKDETGAEVADFPFYHTTAAARSHVKCFLLANYKLDISDKRRFPNWGAW